MAEQLARAAVRLSFAVPAVGLVLVAFGLEGTGIVLLAFMFLAVVP